MLKTSGIFDVYDYDINVKKFNEPFFIDIWGDVHLSSDLCDLEAWEEFKKTVNQPNHYYLGMGDYDDFLSTSEREHIKSGFHDDSERTLNDVADRNVRRWVNEISFMKGKLIGLLEGNHFYRYESGITTTQMLCDKLNCKYLGTNAFVLINLRRDKHHCQTLKLWLHHGMGAGNTIGASINKVTDMARHGRADVYVMGHDHNLFGVVEPIYDVPHSQTTKNVYEKDIAYIRSGSFLCGRKIGVKSYQVDKNYRPRKRGWATLVVTPTETERRINGKRSWFQQVKLKVMA